MPEPEEYVVRGAARQAAWVLTGGAAPPDWRLPGLVVLDPTDVASGQRVRAAYGEARDVALRAAGRSIPI